MKHISIAWVIVIIAVIACAFFGWNWYSTNNAYSQLSREHQHLTDSSIAKNKAYDEIEAKLKQFNSITCTLDECLRPSGQEWNDHLIGLATVKGFYSLEHKEMRLPGSEPGEEYVSERDCDSFTATTPTTVTNYDVSLNEGDAHPISIKHLSDEHKKILKASNEDNPVRVLFAALQPAEAGLTLCLSRLHALTVLEPEADE